MSINYVILGYLSWKPLSGYDLKRIIADSEILPWSANNNQIYRALVRLKDEAWVIKRVENQDGAPDKHIYTITDLGRSALMEWVQGAPDLPQSRKAFFHQLMWAENLPAAVIVNLVEKYQEVVSDKLFLMRVQADRKPNHPGRTKREQFLWDRLYQNWISHYEMEVAWARKLRLDLRQLEEGRLGL